MTTLERTAFLDLCHKYLPSISYTGLRSLEPSAPMSRGQTPSMRRAMESTEIQCDWCVPLCGKKEWCGREGFQMDIKDNWNSRGHVPSKEKKRLNQNKGAQMQRVRSGWTGRLTSGFEAPWMPRWGPHMTMRVTRTCGSFPIMSRNNTKSRLIFSQWFPRMGTLIPPLCFITKVGCRIIYFW